MRARWIRAVAVAAALAGVLVGCTVEGGASTDAARVFERVRPSLALVSTPVGTGSAVLVDGGYLVTDAHVVDPFDAVDVTFEGEARLEDVRVVAVDLVADLALLGPVDHRAPELAIEAPAGDAQGAPAYLIGFPGDQDVDHPRAKVRDGELDGLEEDARWDLTYVRSTTRIGHGQSGGALVDASGRVIGISGLSDDDERALSVAGDDVAAAIERLRRRDGSRWEGLDRGDAATSFSEDAPDYGGALAYYVVGTEDAQHIEVTVRAHSPRVAVSEPGDSAWPWAISGGIDPDDDEDWWFVDRADLRSGDLTYLHAAGDGTWAVDLAPWEAAVLTVSAAGGADIEVETSVPVIAVDTYGEEPEVEVGGEPTRFVLDSLDDGAWISLDLEAGVTYRIAARTPSGDASWSIEADEDPDDAAEADDGGGGIFDTDAVGTFTPELDGLHWLSVYEYSDGATEVEVEVTEA
ncbi:MAG: trypsin-like peptidase domain-containing protein [Acidimicrobiales bacterium]|nr:trypsin-like peptidase domain-containing protein [Acidimicrobiales bacterium]HRW36681.1 serine protease [Aquihabitans sp.]